MSGCGCMSLSQKVCSAAVIDAHTHTLTSNRQHATSTTNKHNLLSTVTHIHTHIHTSRSAASAAAPAAKITFCRATRPYGGSSDTNLKSPFSALLLLWPCAFWLGWSSRDGPKQSDSADHLCQSNSATVTLRSAFALHRLASPCLASA